MSYASHIDPDHRWFSLQWPKGPFLYFQASSHFPFAFPGVRQVDWPRYEGMGLDYSDTNLHLALPVAVSMVIMEFL